MRIMWLLTQLFEIVLVIAGLEFLWRIVRAPFVSLEKRKLKIVRGDEDIPALQKAAREDYARRIRESIQQRATAVGQRAVG